MARAAGHLISPNVVGPQDKVVEFHHLAAFACAMLLDPLEADSIATKVLRRLEGVPKVHEGSADAAMHSDDNRNLGVGLVHLRGDLL